jgi:hypothetical protein
MGAGVGLLRRAMARHGGTRDAFARDVLGRSRATVHRWLTGRTKAMPSGVVSRLRVYLKEAPRA